MCEKSMSNMRTKIAGRSAEPEDQVTDINA